MQYHKLLYTFKFLNGLSFVHLVFFTPRDSPISNLRSFHTKCLAQPFAKIVYGTLYLVTLLILTLLVLLKVVLNPCFYFSVQQYVQLSCIFCFTFFAFCLSFRGPLY